MLGPGVTVIPPETVAPGHGSPDAVMTGVLAAIRDKNYSAYCGYAEPSQQAQCSSQMAEVSVSQLPTITGGGVGYVVIDGDEAVAGNTGTMCASGQTGCFTNNDPAAVFSTLHTFSALWQNAITPTSTVYSLSPLIKINGSWYVYSAS